MGPISGVNVNEAGGASNLQPGRDAGRSAPVGGQGAAQPTSSAGLTGSQAVASLHSAVSQLLQSVGGGIENDRLLRMLLVALILLALLEQQSDDASAGQALGQLGAGTGGRSQYIGIFSSSTTISIQQTNTSIVLATGAEAFSAGGELANKPGGELDLSV